MRYLSEMYFKHVVRPYRACRLLHGAIAWPHALVRWMIGLRIVVVCFLVGNVLPQSNTRSSRSARPFRNRAPAAKRLAETRVEKCRTWIELLNLKRCHATRASSSCPLMLCWHVGYEKTCPSFASLISYLYLSTRGRMPRFSCSYCPSFDACITLSERI